MFGRTVPAALAVALVVAFFNVPSADASDLSEFRASVEALYRFDGRKMNTGEFDARLDKLDDFWKHVTDHKARLLPILRAELDNPSNPPFFFYDGSMLLLTLSEAREDRLLALRVMPKVDLDQIQQTQYLRDMHWFAINGYDTTTAALRILDYPDFVAFIPAHSLTLKQTYSLLYLLFPMEEARYLGKLTERLRVEKNPVSQKSLILALFLSVTPEGRHAIAQFAEDASNPAETRKYARQLLERKPSALDNIPSLGSLARRYFASKKLFPGSTEELREMRRNALRIISDEAIYEFNDLSEMLLARQK